jgi:hypothetical protein
VLLVGVAIVAVEWGAPGSGGGVAEGQGGGRADGVRERDRVTWTTAATTAVHPAAINPTKVLYDPSNPGLLNPFGIQPSLL